jgi:quinol monooxygenase YgiN
MKQYYAQQAKMITQPGKRDEVIQRLSKSLEVLKRTPGCIYYLISTTEEPDVIRGSELWVSKEAKDALASSPETAQVMKELMPLIVSVTDQTVMTVVGGFGLE